MPVTKNYHELLEFNLPSICDGMQFTLNDIHSLSADYNGWIDCCFGPMALSGNVNDIANMVLSKNINVTFANTEYTNAAVYGHKYDCLLTALMWFGKKEIYALIKRELEAGNCITAVDSFNIDLATSIMADDKIMFDLIITFQVI